MTQGPSLTPVTTAADRVPAPVLVLAGIVSVQFGGALAATLVPVIGAGGSVVIRLVFATLILLAVVRPRWTGHSAGRGARSSPSASPWG